MPNVIAKIILLEFIFSEQNNDKQIKKISGNMFLTEN